MPMTQTQAQRWNIGRLLSSLALACAIAFVPRATTNLSESGVEGAIRVGIECLQLPGAAFGLIVYRNVHAISLSAVEVINVTFYFIVVYVLLTAWARHKGRSLERTGNPDQTGG